MRRGATCDFYSLIGIRMLAFILLTFLAVHEIGEPSVTLNPILKAVIFV